MDMSYNLPVEYRIRKFTETDLDNVVAINRACLPENYSPIFFLELYRSFPDTFVVGEFEGKIVGYVMSRIEFGFSELSRFKFARKGHIVSVAVMPEHRYKGIAIAMLLQVLRIMSARHKCNETYLEVRISNQAAINLYKRLEYHIAKKISRYYYDGEDAIVMCRQLPLNDYHDKGDMANHA